MRRSGRCAGWRWADMTTLMLIAAAGVVVIGVLVRIASRVDRHDPQCPGELYYTTDDDGATHQAEVCTQCRYIRYLKADER